MSLLHSINPICNFHIISPISQCPFQSPLAAICILPKYSGHVKHLIHGRMTTPPGLIPYTFFLSGVPKQYDTTGENNFQHQALDAFTSILRLGMYKGRSQLMATQLCTIHNFSSRPLYLVSSAFESSTAISSEDVKNSPPISLTPTFSRSSTPLHPSSY